MKKIKKERPIISIGYCNFCGEEFVMRTKKKRLFCPDKPCRGRFYYKNNKERCNKLVRKNLDSEGIPIKTFAFMVKKTVVDIVNAIKDNKKMYFEKKGEWYIKENAFNIFPQLEKV